MSKLIYFQDPGHGWLRVHKKEINKLGLQYQISGYSYESKLYVYLEEDRDMSLYCKAMGITRLSELDYATKHTNNRSHIRSLPYYTKPVVKTIDLLNDNQFILVHINADGETSTKKLVIL